MKKASLAATIGALLLQLGTAGTSAQEPRLNHFKNFFITGDYVVGGTSLWRKGVNGRATDTIEVTGVPEGVDVVAAFLYVQTAEVVQWSGIDHARFNGVDLGAGSTSIAKALNWGLATPPCWSVAVGGGRRLVTYRADVLRFLPIGENGKTRANGEHSLEVPDHGVSFPDTDESGTESGGGPGPRAVGASLIVVYRDPTAAFRGIVIQDGGVTKKAFATLNLSIPGFYQASTQPDAKMTALVGDGRPYLSERLRFNGQSIATNPFASTAGPKWDNPTFENLPLAPGASAAGVQVAPNGLLSDCLSFSAVVFSTEVQDTDRDGLIDIWESSTTPILDPNGQPLPNLLAMGADPAQPDLFVEVGYMFAEDHPSPDIGPPSYGGVPKPPHSHLPSHAALKLVGDAFANAPTGGINVHFDVGDGYPSGEADPYIIRGAGLARGGEAINELTTVCTRTPTDPPHVCQFSDPGTVGWKTGFQFIRDAVLSGPAPGPNGDDPCEVPGAACVRRFDRNRKDTFRYALFAHAVGLPKSEDPLHPDFHVPRTNTGVGDFPGGDFMVTLGAFDDTDGLPVGTPFMQASTMMHEMGHGLERRHGGEALEPNCKPLYFSSMNYLYQLRGLLDDAGVPHLDFSRDDFTGMTINETSVFDGSLSLLPYRLGWYAPLATSYLQNLSSPVSKHCNGSPLLPTDPAMVRIDARTTATPIDWKANATTETIAFSQDINFNGSTTRSDLSPELLAGSNDWARILLNQVGARRSAGGLFFDSAGRASVGPLSLDAGRGDLGRGDLGRGDLGRGDLGRGDLGRGDLGRGDLGRGDLGTILGRGDLGRGDLGGGDLFVGNPDEPFGELDFETAGDLAKTPPIAFQACVLGETCPGGVIPLHRVRLSWTPPTLGAVATYQVFRVVGPELTPSNVASATLVGQLDAVLGQVDYSLLDLTPLVNGQSYTYFVRARYVDGTASDPSNVVTIVGINAAPTISNIEDRTIDANASTGPIPFTIGDADDFSSLTVSGSSSNTTLVPNANIVFGGTGANRTVTVTPAPNQSGSATITVKVTDGGSMTASDTFVLTVRAASSYALVNVKNLPPSSGVTFRPSRSGTLVEFAWKFATGGGAINSADAQPSVTITSPSGAVTTCSPSAVTVSTVSTSTGGNVCKKFEYLATSKTWVFHWFPKNAAVGTHHVIVRSGKTGQRFPATGPGFSVVFKKHHGDD